MPRISQMRQAIAYLNWSTPRLVLGGHWLMDPIYATRSHHSHTTRRLAEQINKNRLERLFDRKLMLITTTMTTRRNKLNCVSLDIVLCGKFMTISDGLIGHQSIKQRFVLGECRLKYSRLQRKARFSDSCELNQELFPLQQVIQS